MKKNYFLVVMLMWCFNLIAQTEDAWIYFTDKPNASSYLANPSSMLSNRALNRRTNQNIPLDIKDVPLYASYVTQIDNATGINIIARSKWLNCVHVRATLSQIQALENLSFVDHIDYANNTITGKKEVQNHQKNNNKLNVQLTNFNYGQAANQIEMLNGDYLHQQNFTGTGMYIAVIDAGFDNVDIMSAFQRIRNNNQILGTYNFVNRIADVYGYHTHGTMVLSTMAGYVENQYVGTAPDASYYLFISEDGAQEHIYEESLWVEAAEKADSLGVDVINTSLGYTEFDNPNFNHTYADMNGNTTFISRGAQIAFTRGMLLINSAGNSGDDAWHYMGAPADASNVLSIGAVDDHEIITSFSSWGPSSDGRIKPDVCAQGGGAAVIYTDGTIFNGDGTSFAGPILAGAAACFWQAFPNKTNQQIADAIRQSADRYSNPDNHYGYGIPDFMVAYQLLNSEFYESKGFNIFPNPLTQEKNLFVYLPKDSLSFQLTLTDLTGKVVENFKVQDNFTMDLKQLKSGVYILKLDDSTTTFIHKIIVP